MELGKHKYFTLIIDDVNIELVHNLCIDKNYNQNTELDYLKGVTHNLSTLLGLSQELQPKYLTRILKGCNQNTKILNQNTHNLTTQNT
jgi:hypothetical protein